MPTYNTVNADVDICNLALDKIKEAPINALDDNRSAARWMTRNYAPYRDFVLAAFPWSFAIKRAELAADPTPPAFGYNNRFPLPADCLRLQPPRYNGERDGRLIPFAIEGGFVLTDAAGPLRVQYISRVVDVAVMANTPLFIDAFSSRMASGIAHYISGKQALAEKADKDYRDILTQAQFVESYNSTPPEQYANAYDDARRAYVRDHTYYGSSADNN